MQATNGPENFWPLNTIQLPSIRDCSLESSRRRRETLTKLEADDISTYLKGFLQLSITPYLPHPFLFSGIILEANYSTCLLGSNKSTPTTPNHPPDL